MAVKIHALFCGETHEPLYLDKWILEQWDIMDIHTNYIWIISSLTKLLNMAMVRNFNVMFEQTQNHSA
jgi:hypothetical protein